MSKRNRKFYQPEAVENNVVSLNTYYNNKKRQVHLLPKTLNQETYINLLTDPSKIIVFATGPAGTGKTMLAMLAGIKAFKDGLIVVIKANDDSKYKNLVDILDEMNICNIGRYAIVDITPMEVEMLTKTPL